MKLIHGVVQKAVKRDGRRRSARATIQPLTIAISGDQHFALSTRKAWGLNNLATDFLTIFLTYRYVLKRLFTTND